MDGQPFPVGPGDGDYAAVKTGVDGSLVIVSDATDRFASPLRVWASFMDPYQRIAVNPAQEFHARLTTGHASAAADDPDKVNRVTALNYNGSSLFTDEDKSQRQPQNCADAVGQMNQGVGLEGGASKASYANVLRVAGGERPAAPAKARQATDATAETYLADADLTGASHYPLTFRPSARSRSRSRSACDSPSRKGSPPLPRRSPPRFPPGWSLWRHQIDPLLEAGFRVAVPDQRDYGWGMIANWYRPFAVKLPAERLTAW